MNKLKTTRLLVVLFISVTIALGAANIPTDTVIAELTGKQLTVEDLNNRIAKIPAMYRQKYQTPEGKINLLDMLVTEELFYLAALDLKVDQDEQMLARLDDQLKPYFAQELRKALGKEFQLTEDVMREYYNANQDEFPGLTFEEANNKITMALHQKKQQEYVQNIVDEKIAELELVINQNVLDKIDLENLQLAEGDAEASLYTSNNADIKMKAKEFITYATDLKNQGRWRVTNADELKRTVDILAQTELLYTLALERKMDQQKDAIEAVIQVKRGLLLRTVYNQEIVEKIDLSDEAAKAYYDENIAEFSSRASRKIQQFVYADNKEAKKQSKLVKRLMKKENDAEIEKLIEETSLKPGKKGELSYIYQNGIIPGIGKDEVYSEMVWNQNPKKMSKVFENSKGNFVFFRIIEDNISVAEPFADNLDKIKGKMQRSLSKTKFEAMKEELAKKFELKEYPDRLIVKLEAKEYFDNAELAQKGKRYDDAIYYYDLVIKNYPQSADEYKALFMKAFLLSEELNRKEEAVELFEKVINEYLEDELHDSARFMINELTGDGPAVIEFED